jgi:hypothetical protein
MVAHQRALPLIGWVAAVVAVNAAVASPNARAEMPERTPSQDRVFIVLFLIVGM